MFRHIRFVLALFVTLSVAPLPSTLAADPASIEVLKRLVQDPEPSVRLAAVRALARIPSAEAAATALTVLDQPMDPTLEYALWLTLNELASHWIAAVENGSWNPDGRENQLEFGLKSVSPQQASRVLGSVLQTRPLAASGEGPWIELVGRAGTQRELRHLLDLVVSQHFQSEATRRAVLALREADRLRKVRPQGDLSGVTALLDDTNPAVVSETLSLIAQWKLSGPALNRTAALAKNPSVSEPLRRTAVETLRQVGGTDATQSLLELTKADQPEPVRRMAIPALAALDVSAALPAVRDYLAHGENEAAALDFWRQLLRVKDLGSTLAASLPESGISSITARAGIRVAREGGRTELELIEKLAKAAALQLDAQEVTQELLADLSRRALTEGDPHRGEFIYRRVNLACMVCHAIGGAGGKVGPDMTSIGASAPMDYLIESIVLPSAKIKEGYHSIQVTTRDGAEYVGTLARESAEELILRNAAGDEIALAKTDIEEREQGTLSIMPTGLVDELNEQEQLDLYAFLGQLGKPGEFDASRGGVARRWHLGTVVHTDRQNNQENWVWEVPFDHPRWVSTYSQVNGRLTRTVMEQAAQTQFWVSKLALYAGTDVRLAQDARATLRVESDAPTRLWIQGREFSPDEMGTIQADLSAGTHRLLIQMDPNRLPTFVKLTSSEVDFVLD